jgi:hypothetical protein
MKPAAAKIKPPAKKYRTEHFLSGATRREFAGLVSGSFKLEAQLEEWLENHFDQLGLNAVLIGTGIKVNGKEIDMLSLMEDGNFCIVELKRDMAARDAVAQVIEYSRILRQMVRAEINGLFQAATKLSIEDFYQKAFLQPFPAKKSGQALLVILADSFDTDTERLALFLNQHHGFKIHLTTYGFADVKDDSVSNAQPIFNHCLNPNDRLPAVGKLPANVLLVRVREHECQTWAQSVKSGTALCHVSATPMIQSALARGDTTILAYLDRTGFVGMGLLSGSSSFTPDKSDRSQEEETKDPSPQIPPMIKLDVQWEVAVSRERAHFFSEHCQPGEGANELQDEEIWAEAVGILHLRHKRSPKVDLRGTRRHPFEQKRKRAAKPVATVADAVQ